MPNPKLNSFATYQHSAGGQTAVIKATTGTLHRVVVAGDVSAGSGARVKLYDNASTASGVLITELLEPSVFGRILEFELDFENGLAVEVSSGSPGGIVTVVYS